jgi:hypothetical protein
VVDWVPAQPDGRPPTGELPVRRGTVTEHWLRENTRLAADELSQWCLADDAGLDDLLIPLLAGRVRAAVHALAAGTAVYLYGGRRPEDEAAPLPATGAP